MRKCNFYFTVIVYLMLIIFGPWANIYTKAATSMPQGLDVSIEYSKYNSEVWAIVWLDIADEYYTYAPADVEDNSIRPVHLVVNDINGKPFAVRYPLGVERTDYYDSSKIIQSYIHKTPIFLNLGKAKFGTQFEGLLQLLLCSKNHCLPVSLPLKLQVPSLLPTLEGKKYYNVWQKSMQRTHVQPRLLSLGVGSVGVSLNAQDNTLEHYNWAFAPRIFAAELEVTSLNKALILGFLAGIILNLMPCVFPVLTLKASSFLAARQRMDDKSLAEFRMQNLLFAAGMLSLFFIIAVFLGTAGFIWGQFYQSTVFVVFMVVLIFLLALSMFGIFNLPIIDLKSSHMKSPKLQAYTTGMITTLLATPCSGPLLGGVLSWAFTQPLPILVATFMAVGLGMSLPYLLLALKPEWAKILPRPGEWMVVIERLVGFFLLVTALYLLSILPQEVHISMLIGLILIAFCAWIWGQFAGLQASKIRRILLSMGFVLCIIGVVFYVTSPPAPQAKWHNFNPKTFEAELGKTPMLVEFTADWCPNCKFVEKTVLTPEFLEEAQNKYKIKLVRVDITRNNPEGEALLHALESSSIPLTAIFTTGLQASAPIILRDIYTQDMLNEALEKAFLK